MPEVMPYETTFPVAAPEQRCACGRKMHSPDHDHAVPRPAEQAPEPSVIEEHVSHYRFVDVTWPEAWTHSSRSSWAREHICSDEAESTDASYHPSHTIYRFAHDPEGN